MSLEKALDVRKDIISRPGMGINSPLVRRLDDIIKVAYGKLGIEAIKQARISASKIEGSKINALIRRSDQSEEEAPTKKRPGDARLQRLAQRTEGAPINNKLTNREQRNLLRAGLQGQPTRKYTNGSEEGESAVEGKEPLPPMSHLEGPLTPSEVQSIGTMSAREILETFGAARIDLTLQALEQELTGSDRQRANRLKKLIIAE